MPLSLLFLVPFVAVAQAAWQHWRLELRARRARAHQAGLDATTPPAADEAAANERARGGAFVSEDVALRPALVRLLERLAPAARLVGTRLGFAVEAGLVVRANPARLGQALATILQDAVRRAPGGAVLVSAGRHGGRIQIAVSDDGPPAREPATAALRDAAEVIALLGGTMERRAPEGGGVCVIRLPDSVRAAPAAPAAPADTAPAPAQPAAAAALAPAAAPALSPLSATPLAATPLAAPPLAADPLPLAG
jgi:hypothetical protein